MLNHLRERWAAETPILAKKIRNLAITLGSTSMAVLALTTVGVAVPVIIVGICTKIVIGATIIAPVAQLQKPKKDEDN
jgi:ABC-type proline/glycine betaine transport system permease subunit